MAAALRQSGYADPITLIGEEPVAPYQRPPLSKAWLKGEAQQADLLLRPDSDRRPAPALKADLIRAIAPPDDVAVVVDDDVAVVERLAALGYRAEVHAAADPLR